MKKLLIGLLFPLFSFGQTVHHNEEKIIYKGSVELNGGAAPDIRTRLQQTFSEVAVDMADSVFIQPNEEKIQAYASIRMKSTYDIIKKMHLTIQLTPQPSGYTYTIDSVYVTERRRGWKEKRFDSKEMVEALEETGNAAIELEITLNEIDLRLQKLLRLLENEMKNQSATQEQSRISSNDNGSSIP
ncbi:hypothetical protein HRH25_07960 [Flavisolibacter sp. BT320]|nr:hypothetical protein [Flavisolibacter longurius]